MNNDPDSKDRFAVDMNRFASCKDSSIVSKKSTKKRNFIIAALLLILAKFKLIATFLLPVAKVLQLAKLAAIGGKILTTGGTMLLSIVFYAQQWGWKFAVGFVLSIFIHELGHVYAAWRLGIPVSAPIFIPGLGALILQKRSAKSPWEEAIIGIAGPIAGLLAGLGCVGLYFATHSTLYLALAYTGFLINLFNLIPIPPLDGGWVVGAISPYLWLIGCVLMIIGFFTGHIHNPLILILVALSLPRLWRGLKAERSGNAELSVTTPQRIIMGLSYVSLVGTLAVLMSYSLH